MAGQLQIGSKGERRRARWAAIVIDAEAKPGIREEVFFFVATTFPTIPGYSLQTCLGRGAFGVVYEAWWKGDFACAVKVLEEGALHWGYLGAVLEKLLALPPHPGLLPVYAFDLAGGSPHVSMALLPSGAVTLEALAGQLRWDEARDLLGQVAKTLEWLRGEGLGHAGLSGGNVFVVAEGGGAARALLGDVGQAWLGAGAMERLHRQAPYVAPERWREPARARREGGAAGCDVYAFGVLAWRLLEGCWPRGDALFERVLASPGEPLAVDPPAFADWLIREAPPTWREPARGPAEAALRAAVERCLATDPAERSTSLAEVAEALAPAAAGAEGVEESEDSKRGVAGEGLATLGEAARAAGPRWRVPRRVLVALLLLGAGGWGFGIWQRREAGLFREAAQRAGGELASVLEGARAAADPGAAASGGPREGAELEPWVRLAAEVGEARPAEPGALAAWKLAASPVAARLKVALEAAGPGPAEASWGPRWQLAELYVGLGLGEEALPLLEGIARDLGGADRGEAAQLLQARCGRRRGAILWGQQRPQEAVPVLQEASQAFAAWSLAHPDRRDVAREFAEHSLVEGRALRERQEGDSARLALARVARLLGKPGDPGFAASDYFTASDALQELAGLDRAAGQWDAAVAQQMQAIRLLVACDQENKQSVPCRKRLADSYFSLGRLLAAKGTPGDASVAFSEVVKLLSELSKESPGESSYRLQLARTYDEVAHLIQLSRPDLAGAKEALEYQEGSMAILRNLREASPQDLELERQLAAALVLNGELEEAVENPLGGRPQHEEALALLEGLLGKAGLGEAERRECRQLSARAWTALGGIHERADRASEARASWTKALDLWSGLPSDDQAVARGLASVRERLQKEKPAN